MSHDALINLVVIVGPTASGKTAAALAAAQACGGEIICADSRTIYTGMDIGTAKPTPAERAIVPHHGLDVVEPGEQFSAADFKHLATTAIDDIRARGKLPMLVGGTGLYVDAVVFDYDFSRSANQDRAALEALSTEALLAELTALSPDAAPEQLERYHSNRRHLVGAVLAGGINTKRRQQPLAGTLMVGLNPGREVLEVRIRQRASAMFTSGVIAEAQALADQYGWDSEAMTGNIYPIIRRYLAGELTQTQAEELFVISDRHLAKRQMTWFKRNPCIQWFASPEQAGEYLTTKCMRRP